MDIIPIVCGKTAKAAIAGVWWRRGARFGAFVKVKEGWHGSLMRRRWWWWWREVSAAAQELGGDSGGCAEWRGVVGGSEQEGQEDEERGGGRKPCGGESPAGECQKVESLNEDWARI